MPEDKFSFPEYTLGLLQTAPQPRSPWNGAQPAELLARERTCWAVRFWNRGEPDYSRVRSLLPPITKGAYCFLGALPAGPASRWTRAAGFFPGQLPAGLRHPAPARSHLLPCPCGRCVGQCPPAQFLLAGRYPLLFSVHRQGSQVLELLYFVEPGIPTGTLWSGSVPNATASPRRSAAPLSTALRPAHAFPAGVFPRAPSLPPSPTPLAYWALFARAGAAFSLPEPVLQQVAEGAIMACATTFAADHAHYGHLYYGLELHDNFPP